MIRCTDPFEAMTVASGLLVSHGLNIHESEWAPEILQFSCDRVYAGGIHYEVTILLTTKGFRKVKEALSYEHCTWNSYSVQCDPHVRVKLSIEGILHLLVLVQEGEVDEIMAL